MTTSGQLTSITVLNYVPIVSPSYVQNFSIWFIFFAYLFFLDAKSKFSVDANSSFVFFFYVTKKQTGENSKIIKNSDSKKYSPHIYQETDLKRDPLAGDTAASCIL